MHLINSTFEALDRRSGIPDHLFDLDVLESIDRVLGYDSSGTLQATSTRLDETKSKVTVRFLGTKVVPIRDFSTVAMIMPFPSRRFLVYTSPSVLLS